MLEECCGWTGVGVVSWLVFQNSLEPLCGFGLWVLHRVGFAIGPYMVALMESKNASVGSISDLVIQFLWWGGQVTIVFGTERSTSTVGYIAESDGGWRVIDGICYSAGVFLWGCLTCF